MISIKYFHPRFIRIFDSSERTEASSALTLKAKKKKRERRRKMGGQKEEERRANRSDTRDRGKERNAVWKM